MDRMRNANIIHPNAVFVSPLPKKRSDTTEREKLPGDYSYSCNTIEGNSKRMSLENYSKQLLSQLRNTAKEMANLLI